MNTGFSRIKRGLYFGYDLYVNIICVYKIFSEFCQILSDIIFRASASVILPPTNITLLFPWGLISAAEACALVFTDIEILPAAINLVSISYEWHSTGTAYIKPASHLDIGLPTMLY